MGYLTRKFLDVATTGSRAENSARRKQEIREPLNDFEINAESVESENKELRPSVEMKMKKIKKLMSFGGKLYNKKRLTLNLRALSICQNWPAGPVVLNVK